MAPGLQQRLAESFEAALRIADGRAIALEMDSGKEHLFSSKFACPSCSYSLAELEPRLFSFNSPVGACPSCDGLGQVTVFDPDHTWTVVPALLASKSRNTPYAGRTVRGKVRHTVLRGVPVVVDGEARK